MAYGWKFHLAQSGKLQLGGDLKYLIKRTNIQPENILQTNWRAETHQPAFFVVLDTVKKNVVLCIRGTLLPRDILTDLCCHATDFYSNGGKYLKRLNAWRDRGRAHYRMLESARRVAKMTEKIIREALILNPDYNLAIVGHSLGGGVAAVIGTMWKDTYRRRRLTVYRYGCPCVGPQSIRQPKETFSGAKKQLLLFIFKRM